MAQPTTRAEFTEWCLRKLGKPVIEINVDDDQVEDRLDESLSYYWDYHFDGAERIYLSYGINEDDIDNKYVTIPDNIIGVVNIFDMGRGPTTGNGGMYPVGGGGIPGMGGMRGGAMMYPTPYQASQGDGMVGHSYGYNGNHMTDWYLMKQSQALMQQMLVGLKPFRYNRHVNKLHIDTNWSNVGVGNFICAECYRAVDPEIYRDVWKDRWLQNYTTAKIKYQWGSNLTKFNGMQLPGGVQFNGEQILGDAAAEIAKLEEDMIETYSLPSYDMIA
jgi:hypothetical protein